MFASGDAFSDEGHVFAISPGSLLLRESGRVSFMGSDPARLNTVYVAPEIHGSSPASEAELEKVGETIFHPTHKSFYLSNTD